MIEVADVIAVIVLPAGMFVPLTVMPTPKFAVDEMAVIVLVLAFTVPVKSLR